ncbi:MAG: hypothetical protein MI922_10540 [Bacteroidales bacterium]|nr:hypothetical protein [Bacteroidales bacterium]
MEIFYSNLKIPADQNEDCLHCALAFAILNKDLQKINTIIESGIDLNEQTDCNDALYYAIKDQNNELVEF